MVNEGRGGGTGAGAMKRWTRVRRPTDRRRELRACVRACVCVCEREREREREREGGREREWEGEGERDSATAGGNGAVMAPHWLMELAFILGHTPKYGA